jgi:hypothetical protein
MYIDSTRVSTVTEELAFDWTVKWLSSAIGLYKGSNFNLQGTGGEIESRNSMKGQTHFQLIGMHN